MRCEAEPRSEREHLFTGLGCKKASGSNRGSSEQVIFVKEGWYDSQIHKYLILIPDERVSVIISPSVIFLPNFLFFKQLHLKKP